MQVKAEVDKASEELWTDVQAEIQAYKETLAKLRSHPNPHAMLEVCFLSFLLSVRI